MHSRCKQRDFSPLPMSEKCNQTSNDLHKFYDGVGTRALVQAIEPSKTPSHYLEFRVCPGLSRTMALR